MRRSIVLRIQNMLSKKEVMELLKRKNKVSYPILSYLINRENDSRGKNFGLPRIEV